MLHACHLPISLPGLWGALVTTDECDDEALCAVYQPRP